MSSEWLLLQQMLSGGTQAWLPVTLLGGLILIFCFRPDRIQRPRLLKAGCWLMALSILLPAVISFLSAFLAFLAGTSYRSPGGTALYQVMQASNSLERILLGVSILCVLLAMTPNSRRKGPPTPARHPLE